MKNIHLGFQVGTGEPVEIPIKHMAICGQTQESGKTTTLEALITRSGLRAVTFVTKRGEASFTNSRRIDPYFREQADWQFVASILEASRGERMKMERSFIIRASKGAFSLSDVHQNVKTFLKNPKIRGLAADMYLCLDAYLEVIVPVINQVRWATSLDLKPGVNVIDMAAVPDEMQHLVIKSCIDWVLKREENTVVVVPEAWKFIPQGRGTPVKLAAEAFIRQAAALKNFLWLDSQDLGGIDKTILRSVPLWILGVQREANEIKRTLDNIPAGTAKPNAADIATQTLGQFYVCHGRHAIKTYVQPDWMDADEAKAIAIGDRIPTVLTRQSKEPKPKEEDAVTTTQAEELRLENERLRNENREMNARIGLLESQRHTLDTNLAATHIVGAKHDRERVKLRDQIASNGDGEALYQSIKGRLIQEAPGLIRLLTTKPEIEMTISRKTISIDEFSLKGRLARLLHEGFFREPKGPSAIRTALKRTGPDANTANIGRSMDDFTRDGFVTDEGSGYREVPDMKVNIVKE